MQDGGACGGSRREAGDSAMSGHSGLGGLGGRDGSLRLAVRLEGLGEVGTHGEEPAASGQSLPVEAAGAGAPPHVMNTLFGLRAAPVSFLMTAAASAALTPRTTPPAAAAPTSLSARTSPAVDTLQAPSVALAPSTSGRSRASARASASAFAAAAARASVASPACSTDARSFGAVE
eukprot:scaffold17004_cov19-Tisochrysis_lutea.AAC.2